jgi:hypothetical protein
LGVGFSLLSRGLYSGFAAHLGPIALDVSVNWLKGGGFAGLFERSLIGVAVAYVLFVILGQGIELAQAGILLSAGGLLNG